MNTQEITAMKKLDYLRHSISYTECVSFGLKPVEWSDENLMNWKER